MLLFQFNDAKNKKKMIFFLWKIFTIQKYLFAFRAFIYRRQILTFINFSTLLIYLKLLSYHCWCLKAQSELPPYAVDNSTIEFKSNKFLLRFSNPFIINLYRSLYIACCKWLKRGFAHTAREGLWLSTNVLLSLEEMMWQMIQLPFAWLTFATTLN